jgi:hypothetical protein
MFNKIWVPFNFTFQPPVWNETYYWPANKKAAHCSHAAFQYKKAADREGARGSQFLCLTIIETEQQTPSVR